MLRSTVDCLKLTKAMQKTSETLQSVADLYENHVSFFVLSHLITRCSNGMYQARRTQLATHEALKNVAHPSTLYAVSCMHDLNGSDNDPLSNV